MHYLHQLKCCIKPESVPFLHCLSLACGMHNRRSSKCEVGVKVAYPLPPESQAEFASDDVSVPYLAPWLRGPKACP